MQEDTPTLKIPFFERRRRIRKPWTLLFFGGAFLLLPFINYFSMAHQLQVPWRNLTLIFSLINWPEKVLMVVPILVGIGLIGVKRWGWWLFLGYAIALISYNVFALVKAPVIYNLGALAQTLLGMSAVFYFSRRDVSAPYMKMYPRGWRFQKRIPVEVQALVDGIRRPVSDISDAGLYVEWEDCYRELGEEIHIRFTLGAQDFETRAGVVRIDENGAGIAFRGADNDFKRRLTRSLASV